MSNFETFSRQMTAAAAAPYVTIHTRGAFSLNRAALDLLGQPSAVELLFDRERTVVGLRATDPRNRDAHIVRPASSGSPSGPWMVTAMRFMRHYELDLSATRRWDAYVEPGDDARGDVLCLDLREPGTPVTSNRAGTGAADASDAKDPQDAGSIGA